jgi:hypothetical protein
MITVVTFYSCNLFFQEEVQALVVFNTPISCLDESEGPVSGDSVSYGDLELVMVLFSVAVSQESRIMSIVRIGGRTCIDVKVIAFIKLHMFFPGGVHVKIFPVNGDSSAIFPTK